MRIKTLTPLGRAIKELDIVKAEMGESKFDSLFDIWKSLLVALLPYERQYSEGLIKAGLENGLPFNKKNLEKHIFETDYTQE